MKNLNFIGIHTIEHLAEVPEGQIAGLMGGIDLKTKAQAFLKVLKDSREVARLQEMEDALEVQRLQIEDMKKLLAQSESERKAAEAIASKKEELETPKSVKK